MTDQSGSSAPAPDPSIDRALTGIPGLDAILGGGLPTNHLYLIDGEPGAGKTTLALQFLLEGARRGEKGLYVTLSESASELRGVQSSARTRRASSSIRCPRCACSRASRCASAVRSSR